MEKAFLRKGIRYRGQSVVEYAEQIATAYNMESDAVDLFISMVFQASFSYEKFNRERMAEFRVAYRTIRHEVYAELKGLKKLYYMYILGV